MNSIRIIYVVLGVVFILAGPAAGLAQFPDHWTRDPSNPISTEFWGSTVLFHEGTYKAWGKAWGGIVNEIDFATSPDGRDWTIHPASPVLVGGSEPESWYDAYEVSIPSVVIVNGVYHMFYSCRPTTTGPMRIAHATSPDGIMWTKDPANPVLDLGPPGSIDSGELFHPCVVFEEPLFRIWYNCHTEPPAGTPPNIAYATSYDGVSWVRYPTAVLEPGNFGEWDEGFYMMNVIRYQDTYYMFYTGGMGDIEGGTGILQVGYATSPEGVIWSKRDPSEPILPIGEDDSWDDMVVGVPVVMATESEFVMWYLGSGDWENFFWGMATATPDPSNWLEIVFDKNDGIPDKHSIRMGINKVGAASGSLTTPINTYELTQWDGFWIPEHPFILDHSNLSYMELISVASTWTLVWDPGSPTTETVCTIDFGQLQGGEFPRMPVVTMPSDDLTIIDPDPNPPTITWHYGSVEPCVAVIDYVAVNLYGPDSQEFSSDELPCATISWTPPVPLTPGEWVVEVSNEVDVRDVPDGLTMTGDPWPLSNSDWLGIRTLGISVNDASATPDHVVPGTAFRLIGNTPNPFNPQTTIAFEIPIQQTITLQVFDLSGRLVKELITTEPHTPGRHEVVWNGRDDSGRQVASGTYFYRLEAGSYSETKRMVLVK